MVIEAFVGGHLVEVRAVAWAWWRGADWGASDFGGSIGVAGACGVVGLGVCVGAVGKLMTVLLPP